MSVGKDEQALSSLSLIISLMGCVAALDAHSGVEMRPGEAIFEQLFNQGIGQPWVGGNPPGFHGEDQGISTGTSGDIISKYSQFFSMSKGNDHKTSAIKCKQYHIHNIRLIPQAPEAISYGYRGQQAGHNMLPFLKVQACHF
jgi:hypothetical protein